MTKLAPNWLRRSGYRLPTEAEMEYATSAGKRRRAGITARLTNCSATIPGTCRNSKEMPWPVGSKMPNDLGLFDVHGNCFTWCQDEWGLYPKGEAGKAVLDVEGELTVSPTATRSLRGGSFLYQRFPGPLRDASQRPAGEPRRGIGSPPLSNRTALTPPRNGVCAAPNRVGKRGSLPFRRECSPG